MICWRKLRKRSVEKEASLECSEEGPRSACSGLCSHQLKLSPSCSIFFATTTTTTMASPLRFCANITLQQNATGRKRQNVSQWAISWALAQQKSITNTTVGSFFLFLGYCFLHFPVLVCTLVLTSGMSEWPAQKEKKILKRVQEKTWEAHLFSFLHYYHLLALHFFRFICSSIVSL